MKKDDTILFRMFRKGGFLLTLQILNELDSCSEFEFFREIEKRNKKPNTFYRSKNDLLSSKLITYELDADFEKVIRITEKGKKAFEKIQSLNQMLIKN